MRSRRLIRLALVPTLAALLATSAATMTAASTATRAGLVSLGSVRMSPGFAEDMARLPSTSPYGAFVHFAGGASAEHEALLAGFGLNPAGRYPHIKVTYAVGTLGAFKLLTREPSITYLEDNRALQFAGETAVWATRARVAQEDVLGGPYFDRANAILDGSGIGVAVIDSGINATHPDLANRVKRNVKFVCTTPGLINTNTEECFGPHSAIEVPNGTTSDTSSGHGTHVAGIVAGDGTASSGPYPGAAPRLRGTFTGVAPGATLYGFGTGEGISVFSATEAFNYIWNNFASFDPPIRVINNSWGDNGGTPYDPNGVISKMAKKLVNEKKVSIMFSAGNEGQVDPLTGENIDTGAADFTSSYSKDPTPGVVSVANYDDAESGDRDNDLSVDSSRGKSADQASYPDVSAPGSSITSTCVQEVQPICNLPIGKFPPVESRWSPNYATLGGTSMASPHVAGVAALLYQARPELTPAEVEAILQDTAHKFAAGAPYVADVQNAGGTTSYDKGAGLVDVQAALDALGVAHGSGSGGTGEPAVHVNNPGDGDVFDGTGSIAVSGTADDGVPPPVVPGEQAIFSGDGGDFSGPGAADLVGLTVQETPAGATPAGLTYRLTVRDATDFGGAPAAPSITLRLFQNVNGTALLTNISATPAAVTAGTGTPATAVATSVSRNGNTITFFMPYANLGNPPGGSAGHNVRVLSFIGTTSDAAPSSPPAGQSESNGLADANARPQFGRAFTIVRPEITTPPAAQVKIAVDNGAPQPATLNGTSPSYTWTSSVNAAALTNGPHTITATLYLNGLPAVSHTVSFSVQRTFAFTYSVAVTDPAPGSTVPRAVVPVSGIATTDDPSGAQAVTLEVHRLGYSSGQLPATGVSPWSVDVNFASLSAGTYTLTARFFVDGAQRASNAISVIVPVVVPSEISCSPRNVEFWRNQFKRVSASYTAAEADKLATDAVAKSGGYFSAVKELKAALNANGYQTAEKAAARELAALLLNLAAGELSPAMSYKAGLSGREGLDPSVYNVAMVGATVDAAKAWARAQFPDGNLGAVVEVADGINNGQGLEC